MDSSAWRKPLILSGAHYVRLPRRILTITDKQRSMRHSGVFSITVLKVCASNIGSSFLFLIADNSLYHVQASQPRPAVLLLMQSTAAEPRPLDHLQIP